MTAVSVREPACGSRPASTVTGRSRAASGRRRPSCQRRARLCRREGLGDAGEALGSGSAGGTMYVGFAVIGTTDATPGRCSHPPQRSVVDVPASPCGGSSLSSAPGSGAVAATSMPASGPPLSSHLVEDAALGRRARDEQGGEQRGREADGEHRKDGPASRRPMLRGNPPARSA